MQQACSTDGGKGLHQDGPHQTIKVDGDDEVWQAHLSANKLPGDADRLCICIQRSTLLLRTRSKQ